MQESFISDPTGGGHRGKRSADVASLQDSNASKFPKQTGDFVLNLVGNRGAQESGPQATASLGPVPEFWKNIFGNSVAQLNGPQPLAGAPFEDASDGTDISDSSSAGCEEVEEIYFNVAVDPNRSEASAVEQDVVKTRCQKLRACMRVRPCLPCKGGTEEMTSEEVSSGNKLPLYSCPYIESVHSSNERKAFLHHVTGGVLDSTHLQMVAGICGSDLKWMTHLDYVYGAVAIAERESGGQD